MLERDGIPIPCSWTRQLTHTITNTNTNNKFHNPPTLTFLSHQIPQSHSLFHCSASNFTPISLSLADEILRFHGLHSPATSPAVCFPLPPPPTIPIADSRLKSVAICTRISSRNWRRGVALIFLLMRLLGKVLIMLRDSRPPLTLTARSLKALTIALLSDRLNTPRRRLLSVPLRIAVPLTPLPLGSWCVFLQIHCSELISRCSWFWFWFCCSSWSFLLNDQCILRTTNRSNYLTFSPAVCCLSFEFSISF